MDTLKQVLFLCTGNYYRSRFAEYLFNHQAPTQGLGWRAFSRGIAIELGKDNVGPISAFTLAGLAERGIKLEREIRFPQAVSEEDFGQADHIVALKRDEHLPIMEQRHPAWVSRVEYWQVHDIDQANPREALPQIEREIMALLSRLATRS